MILYSDSMNLLQFKYGYVNNHIYVHIAINVIYL